MSSPPPPIVAAFDLDGTLLEGGSVFRWLRHVAGKGAVNRASMGLLLPLIIGGVRSGASADNAKERLFHELLAGRDLEELREDSEEFALAHLAAKGRAKLLARLAWHLAQGHDVVIVSASPQLYVDVIARELKVKGALGTRLAVDARGKLTGGYLGRNCRGSEKMRRLAEWIDEQHYLADPVIYAYGNSRGDRRLLRGATHGYNVGRLGALGSLRHYSRLKDDETTAGE